jgi:hypothetical protein
MFKPGKLYRFKANRDVAFEVHKAFYVKEKRLWKIRVGWWNIGNCHTPWPMGIGQRLEIHVDVLPTVEVISYAFRVPKEEYAPKLISCREGKTEEDFFSGFPEESQDSDFNS